MPIPNYSHTLSYSLNVYVTLMIPSGHMTSLCSDPPLLLSFFGSFFPDPM